MVYYTAVLDYTADAHYYTMVVLHTIVRGYIVVALEIFVHYSVVVAETVARDYTLVVSRCYIVDVT
jgi:hypothetical protein